MTGALLLPDGTHVAPGAAFSGSTSMGMYRSGNNMGFGAAGASGAWLFYSYPDYVNLTAGAALSWSSVSAATNAPDLFIGREAAATLQQGRDSASPIAQTFKGPDGVGTNIAGASLAIAGGRSTGNASPGRLIFQNSPAGASGSSANALKDRWSVEADGALRGWQESSVQTREIFGIVPTLPTATDASRKGRAVFNVWDTAAREAMRIEASGAAPMIGFLGAAAVTRAAHIADASGDDAATVNAILVVLENLGLVATS
jgi:hypothetical protein